MDDARPESPSTELTGQDAARATWRTVQRVGLVASTVSAVLILMLMAAIDPATRGWALALLAAMGMAGGYLLAVMATSTWMQIHGRPVRRPKRDPVRGMLVILQAVVLAIVLAVPLLLVSRVVGTLPLATVFIVGPLCAPRRGGDRRAISPHDDRSVLSPARLPTTPARLSTTSDGLTGADNGRAPRGSANDAGRPPERVDALTSCRKRPAAG